MANYNFKLLLRLACVHIEDDFFFLAFACILICVVEFTMPRKLRLSRKKGNKGDRRRNTPRSTQQEQNTCSEQSQVSTVAESTQTSVTVFVEPPNKKRRINGDVTPSAQAESTVGPSCGSVVIPPQATRTIREPAAGPSHAPSQNAYVFETHEVAPRKYFSL